MARVGSTGRRKSRWRWLLASGLGCVLLAGLALLVLIARTPTPPEPPPLPNPNGYDDLIQASKLVVPEVDQIVQPAQPAIEALRATVEKNREALARARLGLSRESRVPLRFRPDEVSEALDRAQSLRRLGRAFLAEARLAAAEGRIDDVVATDLDLLRLGQATGRGGLLVESQTGMAIESLMGLDEIKGIQADLSPQSIRRIIDVLRQSEDGAESSAEIAAREMAFAQTAHGWTMRVAMMVSPNLKRMLMESLRHVDEQIKRLQAKRRLLTTDLAIRLHQQETGSNPERLADLVPGILPAVPADPFGSGPLIYRRTDDGYQLYSVGPNGKDDGGTPWDPRKPSQPGDLQLGGRF